jgi:hypothetical protein
VSVFTAFQYHNCLILVILNFLKAFHILKYIRIFLNKAKNDAALTAQAGLISLKVYPYCKGIYFLLVAYYALKLHDDEEPNSFIPVYTSFGIVGLVSRLPLISFLPFHEFNESFLSTAIFVYYQEFSMEFG